jgi:hypothetical protein
MAKIAKDETAHLISADKVEGTSVYNTATKRSAPSTAIG